MEECQCDKVALVVRETKRGMNLLISVRSRVAVAVTTGLSVVSLVLNIWIVTFVVIISVVIIIIITMTTIATFIIRLLLPEKTTKRMLEHCTRPKGGSNNTTSQRLTSW